MSGMLRHHDGKWCVVVDAKRGIVHLGLDSEGTGREETNILLENVSLTWENAVSTGGAWEKDERGWQGFYPDRTGTAGVNWRIWSQGPSLCWQLSVETRPVTNLCLTLPVNPLIAAAVLLPNNVEGPHGLPPWLLVAPDLGHLLVEVDSAEDVATGSQEKVPGKWVCTNDGHRGASPKNAPREGVDPSLQGEAWLNAVQIPGYRPGKLNLKFQCETTLPAGSQVTFRLKPVELTSPAGLDDGTWRRIRRSYLNHWQPCGTWCGREKTMVLANNVLSDPASVSLWYYAEPMLFVHEPVPGVDLLPLLRRSVDYWLENEVGFFGHVNAFGRMFDLYVHSGATLVAAARHYWFLSGDTDWLKGKIKKLHDMADFLVRRDVDGDGLVESIHSGNSGGLREPDRADIWFEMMHFGHKNAFTNAHTYRAFLYLAEMLEEVGHPKGAAYYRCLASNLATAFVNQLLSPDNGWFMSWISQDGEMHDYCHTFINGMAVAYGIVDVARGREILTRVVEQSHRIGFNCWHLGVPGNLLPCRRGDMVFPPIDLDGEPVKNHWGNWPAGMTEEAAFGNIYPNGTIHPALVWPYLLGLQVAGLNDEADRILHAMLPSAQKGLFQNGIVNTGFGGAEHFYSNGRTCGYEGYLPESFNFLMAWFTRERVNRERLLGPLRLRNTG